MVNILVFFCIGKRILLDKAREVEHIVNADMDTGFLYLNRSNFARQYIFPAVSVFANRNDQRWLAGFLA